METYRTAGNSYTTGNPLCDRLQREFRGRGIGAAHVQTESTSEMIRRIQMGLDPYEGVPDPNKATVSYVTSAPRRTAAQPQRRPVQTAQPQTRQARPAQTVRPNAAPQNKQAVRAAGASKTKSVSAEQARRRSAAAAARRSKEKRHNEEIRIHAPFPYAAVTMLSMFTVMLMVILFSFAQNYELTSEISSLENQARDLVQLERELSVQLEERDDIRVIENIAVNELGMVKNDLVENRYVSISGGDRVELAEETEGTQSAKESGIFSTMLSSLGENWDRLLEYIE